MTSSYSLRLWFLCFWISLLFSPFFLLQNSSCWMEAFYMPSDPLGPISPLGPSASSGPPPLPRSSGDWAPPATRPPYIGRGRMVGKSCAPIGWACRLHICLSFLHFSQSFPSFLLIMSQIGDVPITQRVWLFSSLREDRHNSYRRSQHGIDFLGIDFLEKANTWFSLFIFNF